MSLSLFSGSCSHRGTFPSQTGPSREAVLRIDPSMEEGVGGPLPVWAGKPPEGPCLGGEAPQIGLLAGESMNTTWG